MKKFSKICLWCTKPYKSVQESSRYCCASHRQRAYLIRREVGEKYNYKNPIIQHIRQKKFTLLTNNKIQRLNAKIKNLTLKNNFLMKKYEKFHFKNKNHKQMIKNFQKKYKLNLKTKYIPSELNINNTPQNVLEFIQTVICTYYNITTQQIQNITRKKEIVLVRQIMMYFLRNQTRYSLTIIGKFCGGKDHATVLYACKRIEKLMQNNEQIKSDIDILSEYLKLNPITIKNDKPTPLIKNDKPTSPYAILKTCMWCGEPYKTISINSKYCCDSHRQMAFLEKHNNTIPIYPLLQRNK